MMAISSGFGGKRFVARCIDFEIQIVSQGDRERGTGRVATLIALRESRLIVSSVGRDRGSCREATSIGYAAGGRAWRIGRRVGLGRWNDFPRAHRIPSPRARQLDSFRCARCHDCNDTHENISLRLLFLLMHRNF